MPVALLPLFGAALGAAGGALFLHAARVLPATPAALIAVALWIAAPHALPGDRPRIWAQLGAGVMWCLLLARLSVSLADPQRLLLTCLVGQTVPRAAVVAIAWVSRPAPEGLKLAGRMQSWQASMAVASGVFAASLRGARIGTAVVVGCYLIVRAARAWCYRRKGGIDGTGIAAVHLAVEVLAALSFGLGSA